MQSQVKDFKGPKKHKKVAIDLNTKFANVDLIKEVINKVEKEEVSIEVKEVIL